MNETPRKEDLVPYTGGKGWNCHISIPTEVLSWGLSGNTLAVYCLLLDRMGLSRKNGRKDEGGTFYVNYTGESLAGQLGFSRSTIRRVLRELEEKGLLRRVNQGKKAVRYYPQGLACWEKATGSRNHRSAKSPEDTNRVPTDPGDLDQVLREMAETDASF